jgi:hypothetical protein
MVNYHQLFKRMIKSVGEQVEKLVVKHYLELRIDMLLQSLPIDLDFRGLKLM